MHHDTIETCVTSRKNTKNSPSIGAVTGGPIMWDRAKQRTRDMNQARPSASGGECLLSIERDRKLFFRILLLPSPLDLGPAVGRSVGRLES